MTRRMTLLILDSGQFGWDALIESAYIITKLNNRWKGETRADFNFADKRHHSLE